MTSIDVAVPCYQYAHYLRGCVESILRQDGPKLRVLVIDNASTDGSLAVASELASEDPRVEVVAHRVNLGQHASYNEAIDWASSKYFMLLSADDLLAPGALARAVSVMEREPEVNFAHGGTLYVSSAEPIPAAGLPAEQPPRWRIVPGRQLLERFCYAGRNHVNSSSVVVRTSAQKRAGHYRPYLAHTDDFELWMRFACLGSVAETDAIQAVARVHPENRSTSVSNIHLWDLEFEAAFASFFAREGASLPAARRLHRIARRSLAQRAYWSGVASIARGETRLGLNLLKFALTRSPRTVVPPIGYLFRRPDTLRKIAEIAGRLRPEG